jgi:hypothetical protein
MFRYGTEQGFAFGMFHRAGNLAGKTSNASVGFNKYFFWL